MRPLFQTDRSILLKRGSRHYGTVTMLFGGQPADLTGYAFELRIGPALGNRAKLVLSTTAATPGGSVLRVDDPLSGKITYDISAADSAIPKAGPCAFDFIIISGDVRETFFSGDGTIEDEIR